MKIPGDVLTEEDKLKLHERIVKQDIKDSKLIDSFEMLAKRARNSLNRGDNNDDDDN